MAIDLKTRIFMHPHELCAFAVEADTVAGKDKGTSGYTPPTTIPINGKTLDIQVTVNSVVGSIQTITFPSNYTDMADVATYINTVATDFTAFSVPGTASALHILLSTDLQGNRQAIRVKNTSTASALGYPVLPIWSEEYERYEVGTGNIINTIVGIDIFSNMFLLSYLET